MSTHDGLCGRLKTSKHFFQKHLLCNMQMVFSLFSRFSTLTLQIAGEVKKEGHRVSKSMEGCEKKIPNLIII
jgi:hypothetical protein